MNKWSWYIQEQAAPYIEEYRMHWYTEDTKKELVAGQRYSVLFKNFSGGVNMLRGIQWTGDGFFWEYYQSLISDIIAYAVYGATEAVEAAKKISRHTDTYLDDCKAICALAGLEDDWQWCDSTPEQELVVFQAADRLGVAEYLTVIEKDKRMGLG